MPQVCIEAGSDESGYAVFVNRCHGGPTQLWDILPLENDRKKLILLTCTNTCLQVNAKAVDQETANFLLSMHTRDLCTGKRVAALARVHRCKMPSLVLRVPYAVAESTLALVLRLRAGMQANAAAPSELRRQALRAGATEDEIDNAYEQPNIRPPSVT